MQDLNSVHCPTLSFVLGLGRPYHRKEPTPVNPVCSDLDQDRSGDPFDGPADWELGRLIK